MIFVMAMFCVLACKSFVLCKIFGPMIFSYQAFIETDMESYVHGCHTQPKGFQVPQITELFPINLVVN